MSQQSFGTFADGGREFVVAEPDTPRGLVNYAWNPVFISGFSQHGGGDGVYKERAIQYVDPRGRNLMVRDGHRYFYLRDQQNGALWSPGWHPVQTPLDRFECVHGLGYSIISSACNGVETTARVFVPAGEPCEIWTITLANARDREARLKLYTFVDWLLLGYTPYSDYYSYLTGRFHEDIHTVQCRNRAVERPHDVFDGFVASDRAPSGFDTSRRAFLGNFGHVNRPAAVVEGRCRNSRAACEKMVGVLEHTLALAAGESTTLHVLVGASSGYEMTKEIVTSLLAEGRIEDEFAVLRARKEEMANRLLVQTPDEHVNHLMNHWLKQQVQIYADVGSDNGRGFRDAMQLLWATASYDLAYTRRMLDECLRHQYADGHTLRGWLPVDDHHYSDGPVWIAPVVDAYLKESGDAAILDHVVPYFGGGEGSVWDHVLRGLRHSSDDLGEHGLVRCHFGDWNDSLTGVGVGGKGESVWTTIAIVYSLKVAAGIARRALGDDAVADELLKRAARLTAAIHEHAWDGEWYLRAINDHGEKVGTRTEEEGRIYLLPQVWAILAGIVDDERREQLYRAVDEHLESRYGSLTLSPPYTVHNPRIGRLTAMEPGIWENGSPYNHSNGFKIIADCVGGRGERAWVSYQKAMPDNPWTPSTHSGCEPYAFSNQHLGPDNPRAGETQFAWMTGTAGWYYRAMAEWMLGVRAEYGGLRVDPCLPPAWETCSLERDYRGARYRVEIENPHGLEKGGSLRILVDGEPLEGDLVPAFGDGETHLVQVRLEK
jgi:cellobiose phosphorylase